MVTGIAVAPSMWVDACESDGKGTGNSVRQSTAITDGKHVPHFSFLFYLSHSLPFCRAMFYDCRFLLKWWYLSPILFNSFADIAAHRRTGQHPFGGSNRVLPEWRTQLVCYAPRQGEKNNNELLKSLF